MNKVLKVGFLAAVALIGSMPAATAAGQPWACQYTADAGLRWENGSWKATNFREGQPFVLVQDGDLLTRKSVSTALTGDDRSHILIRCRWNEGLVFCRDTLGTSLVFSPTTGQGGLSLILGATQNNPEQRDTVHVKHFICQKY